MTTTYIHLPMLEILLADRFSTSRSLSDARGARFVILFPERSSLSRFIHSPMHPRSYISKIYIKNKNKNKNKKTHTHTQTVCYRDHRLHILQNKNNNKILPRLLSLRNKMDSKSNSPVRDFRSPVVIFAHSSAKQAKIKRVQECVVKW